MRLNDLPASWLLLALLALAGCLPFGQQEERPLLPLKDETVVILPFKMPNGSYFESQVGARFSRDIGHWIHLGCPRANVGDVDALPKSLIEEGAKEFKKDDVMEDSALVKVGKQLEAHYAVIGEIHELRSKDRKDVNLFRGTMVLSARVADIRLGKVIWECERKAFSYPPAPPVMEYEKLAVDGNEDEETVLRMTMQEAARNIAALFAGHDKLFLDQRR